MLQLWKYGVMKVFKCCVLLQCYVHQLYDLKLEKELVF